MKITRRGLQFDYDGDPLTYLWPWRRPPYRSWYSERFGSFFETLSSYVSSVENLSARTLKRVSSLSTEEALQYILTHDLTDGNYILLYDLNPDSKPSSFWDSLADNAHHFSRDIVILRAKDTEEMSSLLNSIDNRFAKTVAASYGVLW